MQIRMEDVVKAVRARLGDSDGTGWSDERLMLLINQGQFDICATTNIYRSVVYLPLVNNKKLYLLPDNCFNITRIEYKDEILPIYSREDIDNTLSPPTNYAIKSNLNRRTLEMVPPFEDIQFFTNYIRGETVNIDFDAPLGGNGVVANVQEADLTVTCMLPDVGCTTLIGYQEDDMTDEELELMKTVHGDLSGFIYEGLGGLRMDDLGIFVGTTSFTGTESPNFSVFGFLSSIGPIDVKGIFGITTGFVIAGSYAKVYYTATPPIVDWMDGHLTLDTLWLQALVHYATGIARQDDNDAGNYQLGELELAKYRTEVAKVKKMSARNFNSQTGKVREVIYRRF